MRGVVWCIWLVSTGLALALGGLAAGWDGPVIVGAGMLAAVVFGWPLLLLAGAAHDATRRGSGH